MKNRKFNYSNSYSNYSDTRNDDSDKDHCETSTPRIVQIDGTTYKFNDYADRTHRSIKGKEIIDWISCNNLYDVNIFCSPDSLFVSMTDTDDENHYHELHLYWNKKHLLQDSHDGFCDPRS